MFLKKRIFCEVLGNVEPGLFHGACVQLDSELKPKRYILAFDADDVPKIEEILKSSGLKWHNQVVTRKDFK